jgi:hypothetical protein
MRGPMGIRWVGYCCVLLLASLAPDSLWSQAVGTILGTVTDSSGAVIPQAKVTAVRDATQVSQSTLTGSAGTFAIPHLDVGTYTVKVDANGFASETITGVTLDVSQERNLDFRLSLAGVTQTVGVSAAPPLINTTNGSLAGLVSQEQVQELPLNGRSIENLVMLQPGMAQDQGSMGWLAPQWIGNGNRGETAVATLDGADATDSEMGTVQFWNFNLDAIAEFKVQQANYSAEFGQGGGTITQIVSKSGTNRFHGSAFEFIRNSYFDAANYFSANGVSPLQRNEFGATIGGPIIRDRTFFFGEYAGFRQLTGTPTPMLVPTAAQRTGLVTIGTYQYQVPLNPVGQQVLNGYPKPNQPNGIYGANTYNTILKEPLTVNQYSIRIDHKISEKDSIFGRASVINNQQLETDPVAAAENPQWSSENFNNPRNFALSETHIFSPNLIDTTIFSVNRQIEGSVPPSQEYTQTITADASLANYGPDTFITKYVETYYIATNKVNWTRGRNVITMGMDYRYGQDNGFGVTSAGPNGQYTFNAGTSLTVNIPSTNGGPTILAGTGSPSGLVSVMAGDPEYYKRATTMPGFGPAGGGGVWWGLRIWHIAPYIQDDVKFTPKLTLNLGLRYEYNSVPYEIESRLGAVVDRGPLYGQFVLNPRPLYQPDKTSFAPRFGFAYQAAQKTVVRGGLSVFTNSIPLVLADQAAVNFPLASFSALTTPPYSLTPLPVTLPTLTSTSGAVMPPSGGPKNIPANTPVNLTPISAVTGQIIGDWASEELRNGYSLTGNLTIEQQLPGDMALQSTYLLNNGYSVNQSSYPNAFTSGQPANTPYTEVTPGLGEVELFFNNGVSRYNALQLQLRKISPMHGATFQANYTWGKDLTDADAIWGGAAPGNNGGVTQNNPTCVRCEYARASYNVTQRFVANFAYHVPGSWGFVPSRISSGWQALGIYNIQSGFPFTIVGPYGTYQYGYDSFNGVGARPFFLKTATRNPLHRGQFFSNDVIENTANYFSIPTTTSTVNGLGTVQTTPGDLGRNTYTGPSWWNLDFSVLKDTHLTEWLNMQFRAEFFNIFNHPTMGTPNGTISSPSGGPIGSTSFGLPVGSTTQPATPSTEREIQFGVRFIF